jgi:hypothetical protein
MTTTPVEQAQSPTTEQDASSDNLIHSEDDITSTDSLPASNPTPDGATSGGDAAPEPEPEKAPEANQETAPAEIPQTTEEWEARYNNRESAIQTQLRELREAQQAAEQRAQKAENATMEEQYANQLIARRDQRRDALIDSGMDEMQALDTANAEAREEVTNFTAARGQTAANSRISELEAENARIAKLSSVDSLVRQHGVPESQRSLLLATTNADEAVALASTLGQAERNRRELERLTQNQVPANGVEQQMDGGGGGSTMTDQQIVDAYGNGTFSDHAAATSAMERLGL